MVATQEELVQRYVEASEKEMESKRMENLDLKNNLSHISSYMNSRDTGLVEAQLQLEPELDRIFHLLSGHMVVKDAEGNERWAEPDDDRLKIFSEYGVKQIMNLISFYVNRNTLLSFYDEETIKWKVHDFGIELADLILSRYEHFFYYPSPEEMYDKYLPIIKAKNLNITEEELYDKCVDWSNQELESKSGHYIILCMAVIDVIDSTYRRALKGEERKTIRQFIHVTQNTPSNQSPSFNQEQKWSILHPFSTWK